MAGRVLPGFSWLVIMRYRFDTAASVSKVKIPVLVVHSEDDEIIPFAHARTIFDAANAPKKLLKIRGSHNGGFLASQPGYEQGLSGFLHQYAGTQ
jgi:fermentation-respiration switch protein FrsA (DUF1100 family)